MSRINSVDVNEYQEVKQRLRQSGKRKFGFRHLAIIVAVVAVFQLGIVGGILISKNNEGHRKSGMVADTRTAISTPKKLPTPMPETGVLPPRQPGIQQSAAPVTEVKPAERSTERSVASEQPARKRIIVPREDAVPKKKRLSSRQSASLNAPAPPLSIDVAGGDIGRAYAAGMRTIIERHKEPPVSANGNPIEGRCLVVCIIKRDGSLKHAEIIRTSGNSALDAAALRSVRKAGNFPAVPDAIPGEELSFDVPLTFRARGE